MNENQTTDDQSSIKEPAEKQTDAISRSETRQPRTEPSEDPKSRESTSVSADDEHKDRKANAESARYRHRLREAEAERDRLAEVAKTASRTIYQQATQALRSNGDALRHPEDLGLFTGKQPGDYIKDGQLDQEELQADVDRLHQERPELFHRIGLMLKPDKSQGMGLDAFSSGDRWHDAFKTA